MTYEEQIQYYSDLLIIQYRNKPLAQATIQLLARYGMITNLPIQIRDAFDLETAVGVQLDTIGKYAGVSRRVLTFTGGVVLSDSDYRTLIKLAILRNTSSGSLESIDSLLFQYFGTNLLAFDALDMRLSYWMNSQFGTEVLAQALVTLGLLPKPMGVQLSSLIYAGGLGFLGFRTYEHAAAAETYGWQTYDTYDPTPGAKPWLSYADTITIPTS